jgi:hypothetical protein
MTIASGKSISLPLQNFPAYICIAFHVLIENWSITPYSHKVPRRPNSSKVTVMVSGVLLIEAADIARPVHKLCHQTQYPKQDQHLESPRARPVPLPALSFDASQQVVQKREVK